MQVITGLSPSGLRGRVHRGKAFRVINGLYVDSQPEPIPLLGIVHKEWPRACATGPTAAQLYLGQAPTFPLYIARHKRPAKSEYISMIRTKQLQRTTTQLPSGRPGQTQDLVHVHLPVLAAQHIDDDDLALRFLEQAYASRRGRDELEHHLRAVKRTTAGVRKLLEQAALASDSNAERKVVRRLREGGLRVETNVRIGEYYWDIVIPKLKVAVEINGYRYHTQSDAFIRDHWKNNDAALRGWLTLRYTGSDVAYLLDDVVEQILRARKPNFNSRAHVGVWRWHWHFLRDGGDLRYGP